MGRLFSHLDPEGPMLQVREGMAVYDRDDRRVGTVKDVHLGDGTELARETGAAPATADHPAGRHGSLFEDLGAAIDRRDHLPAGTRDHLMRVGYVAIDAAGFFTGDRFATADQVASVEGDRVRLAVADDELIRG